MIAVDIGPHPAAPEHYIEMRKPEGWNDDDCGTLSVRRVGATGEVLSEPAARIVRTELPTGENVYPAYLSEWVPDKHELALLLAGEPVRLLISGNALPPCAMWVRDGNEV